MDTQKNSPLSEPISESLPSKISSYVGWIILVAGFLVFQEFYVLQTLGMILGIGIVGSILVVGIFRIMKKALQRRSSE
jgi:hypothetical protein